MLRYKFKHLENHHRKELNEKIYLASKNYYTRETLAEYIDNLIDIYVANDAPGIKIREMNELAKQIHEYAKAKGFWDNPRDTGTLLMLIVSELAEAMEADRNGRIANIDKFHKAIVLDDIFEASIKDTFEDEMADTIIRILDLCAAKGIDIDRHIELKMKYNATRSYRHGNKSY